LLPIPTAYIVAYYGFVATLLVLPRKKVAAILAIAAVLILITSSAIARFNEKPLRIVYLSLPGRPAIAFQNGKTYLIGEKPPKAPVKRAMKALGLSPGDPHVLIKEAGNGFKLCEGNVCFLFAPPAVRRGSEEFDIIASRLEKSAVEASTDGSTIQLQGARRAP
jgi:hypothetical protein